MQPGPSSLPAPGQKIAGKYRMVRVLGVGGMGAVVEAEHLKQGHSVALKLLHPHIRAPEILVRFEREARAAARLTGRHITRVLDVGVQGGTPYMVMELLRGHDLLRELQLRGPLPVLEAIDWVCQACVGMVEAHALGIVHRDLKPANLFLAETPEGRVLKVLDFGVSKVSGPGASELTGSLTMLGTLSYMSPEHIRSARDVDARTDVWSLGVILYFLLTGTHPFTGDNPGAVAAAIVAAPHPSLRALRPDVPEAVERVFAWALAKNRDDRCPTVEALGRALAEAAGSPLPSASGAQRPDAVGAPGSAAQRLPPPRALPPIPPPLSMRQAAAPPPAPEALRSGAYPALHAPAPLPSAPSPPLPAPSAGPAASGTFAASRPFTAPASGTFAASRPFAAPEPAPLALPGAAPVTEATITQVQRGPRGRRWWVVAAGAAALAVGAALLASFAGDEPAKDTRASARASASAAPLAPPASAPPSSAAATSAPVAAGQVPSSEHPPAPISAAIGDLPVVEPPRPHDRPRPHGGSPKKPTTNDAPPEILRR